MAPCRPLISAAMCAYGRALAEPRLSPDGSNLAFVSSTGGRAQLVVTDAAGGAELVVTSQPPPTSASAYEGGCFDWTRDGRGLVYAGVEGGLWWVDVNGGPPAPVADARSEEGRAMAAPAVSPDGTVVAFVSGQREVAVVDLAPGAARAAWPRLLSSKADFAFDPVWSPDGALVAWQEWDVPAMPWDESRVVVGSPRAASGLGLEGEPIGESVARAARRRSRQEREKPQPIGENAEASPRSLFETVAGGDGVQAQQPRFSPDGRHLALLCDAHGYLNLWIADVTDGVVKPPQPLLEEPFEHGGPSWGLGQRSFAWSPDSASIAVTRNEAGFGRLVVVSVETGDVRELGKGVHGGLSWVGDRIAAIRSGARTPHEVVVYERGERRRVARGPVMGFERAALVEPEPVDWRGDDGAVVHGRLYRPSGSPPDGAGELPPVLVWIHGGPTDQWETTFIPRIAYFVDRGWAVLVPDHRGSTGWGRAYMQAMAGRWGELDVTDVAAGMRAAADNGWCDPHRMVPIGGSAGGFSVLNLLARAPELCAAGVDLFGVTDLLELDEVPYRFEAHYLHSVVGPLPEAAALYRSRSPVSVADRITAPLLVLQGDADQVVPAEQSRAIASRLESLGRTVEMHVYEGEGHGWRRPETVVDELTRIESFLRRHVIRWREPADAGGPTTSTEDM